MVRHLARRPANQGTEHGRAAAIEVRCTPCLRLTGLPLFSTRWDLRSNRDHENSPQPSLSPGAREHVARARQTRRGESGAASGVSGRPVRRRTLRMCSGASGFSDSATLGLGGHSALRVCSGGGPCSGLREGVTGLGLRDPRLLQGRGTRSPLRPPRGFAGRVLRVSSRHNWRADAFPLSWWYFNMLFVCFKRCQTCLCVGANAPLMLKRVQTL